MRAEIRPMDSSQAYGETEVELLVVTKRAYLHMLFIVVKKALVRTVEPEMIIHNPHNRGTAPFSFLA